MKKTLKKIDNGWLRFAVLILAGINTGAMILDVELLPFNNKEVVEGLSIGAMVLSEVWNHWKNNDWTATAKQATKWLESQKKG